MVWMCRGVWKLVASVYWAIWLSARLLCFSAVLDVLKQSTRKLCIQCKLSWRRETEGSKLIYTLITVRSQGRLTGHSKYEKRSQRTMNSTIWQWKLYKWADERSRFAYPARTVLYLEQDEASDSQNDKCMFAVSESFDPYLQNAFTLVSRGQKLLLKVHWQVLEWEWLK